LVKKKLILIAVVGAFVATPALADYYGGMADYSQLSAYATGQGGEFRLEPDVGFNLSNAMYADSTKNQGVPGSFQSFCIEVGEHIYSNSHLKVSETYVNGTPGSHAYGGGNDSEGPPPGDNLGSRTAYLYQQFALGLLEGYVYDTSTSTRTPVTFGGNSASFYRWETAGVLQRVLWALEDEGGSTWSTKYYGVDLGTDEQALAAYWYSSMDIGSWTGIGNVRVLQLYGSYESGVYSCNRQDQLYLVPVPAAVLLGMLGLGAAGLKLRKCA
jgi:hypothetical protein